MTNITILDKIIYCESKSWRQSRNYIYIFVGTFLGKRESSTHPSYSFLRSSWGTKFPTSYSSLHTLLRCHWKNRLAPTRSFFPDSTHLWQRR